MLQFSPGQVGAGWRTHLPSLRAGGRAEKGRGPRHDMCPANASPASVAPAFSGGLKELQCAWVPLRRAIQRALSRKSGMAVFACSDHTYEFVNLICSDTEWDGCVCML